MGFDLREKGVPTIDDATCTICGLCVEACPNQLLSIEDGRVWAGDGSFMGCIACGHCAAVCPSESITVSGRGMVSDDPFELPPAFHRATADQLEALLQTRRSVRRFTGQEVEPDTIDRILEMTATAPMGLPPSEVGVVVFHGHIRVQIFAGDACAAFERMGWFFRPITLGLMRPFIGKDQYETMRTFVKPLFDALTQARREGKDWFTYNAPAALLFHHGPMADPADCHIAATYAMLAAESLGLGSCMLGTTEALSHDKAFKAKYGIPPKNKVGLGLALGYSAEEFCRGVRRRLASVVFA